MKPVVTLSLILALIAVGNFSACTIVNQSGGGSGRTIGHQDVNAFASLSPAQKNQARSLKTYFEHASVGGNIMAGLGDLVAGGNQINIGGSEAGESADAVAAKTWFQAQSGVFDNARGNPGFIAKVDNFRDSMIGSTVGTSVDVAMMKFCYIDDVGVNFDYYINTMASIRSSYPTLRLVYMTMPLMTAANDDRNTFNAQLRAYCKNNGLWLFDIADIESHDTNGNPCLDGGKEALVPGYSTDGGHLNDLANVGRQRAAKAWWVMLAAIAANRS